MLDTAISWSRVSDYIGDAMGLHFPGERLQDLQRGLAAAAVEFGFDDAAACADWMLSAPLSPADLHVLAGHLTIGETYFFRDEKLFDALAGTVLPALLRAREGKERRLRVWSAGCCTGEEAYSLAILLHQLIPDLARGRRHHRAGPREFRGARNAGRSGATGCCHARPPGRQDRVRAADTDRGLASGADNIAHTILRRALMRSGS